jgi:transposase
MNLHANAALSLKGRRELCLAVVERERTLAQAAEAAGVSVRCARKWVGRYRAEGETGLRDRSSAPHRIPHRTSEQRVEAIAALRRLRFTGPEIAEVLGMSLSTVSGILHSIGVGKLGRLCLEPTVRYEREAPDELIHIDITRLGRIQRGAGPRFTPDRPPGASGQPAGPPLSRHPRHRCRQPRNARPSWHQRSFCRWASRALAKVLLAGPGRPRRRPEQYCPGVIR